MQIIGAHASTVRRIVELTVNIPLVTLRVLNEFRLVEVFTPEVDGIYLEKVSLWQDARRDLFGCQA